MKIQDIIMERRQQKTGIYFHGTSSVFLRSILKNGLLKNPPKRVYSSDGIEDDDQQTFPNAVYLTQDEPTAYDAAFWATDSFGGYPIIVTVQYVYNSGEMDEDEFTFKLTSILDQNKIKNSFIKEMLKLFTDMSYNKKIVVTILQQLHDLLMDTLRREGLSTNPKNFKNNNIVSLVRNDEEYIRLVSELLRRINPKKSETVRVPRDIGFRGKTKIIKIHNPETEEIFYPKQK